MNEFGNHNSTPTIARERVQVKQEWNALTARIIEAAMEVHSELGPGLLESLYEDALCFELSERGLLHRRQLAFSIPYKSIVLREQRCDILVESLVVLELKAVDKVDDRHLAAMLGYMRALDAPLGLLLNFNQMRMKDGIYRRINSRSAMFQSASRPHNPSPVLTPRTSACPPRNSAY